MSSTVVHAFDVGWVSSAPALQVSVDTDAFVGAGPASNRLDAPAGAAGATASVTPGAPLDLSGFDELRFWIRSTRTADGSQQAPFLLELSFTDANDSVGETHAWFVPVNRRDVWEQRRIGIASERRSAVDGIRFRCLTGLPFACNVDELLAVQEEMLADVERELVATLESGVRIPGLADVPLQNAAGPGDQTVVLPLTHGFAAGNRVLVEGGSAGPEVHGVTQVDDDAGVGTTTLHFGGADAVAGTLPTGSAHVSLLSPVLVEAPPAPTPAVAPAIVATPLGAIEDQRRSGKYLQRDSFRLRGAQTVCSVRPSARAYVCDYQLTAVAPSRVQQAFLYEQILHRLSLDAGLRVNGSFAPVSLLEPPHLRHRTTGQDGPVYVRIGTRLEVAPRREQVWVEHVDVAAARIDAPLDLEGIVLEL
jgi:hypothetical protein